MEFDWKDGRYAAAYAMGYLFNASMQIIDELTLQKIANQTGLECDILLTIEV